MSSVNSPGPSTTMFPQSTSATPSARQKGKAYTAGIAAGVEDEKYQTKYKELKRKVKEIELVGRLSSANHVSLCSVQDNDKLKFKVLMAKKSIQRMKLERACVPSPSGSSFPLTSLLGSYTSVSPPCPRPPTSPVTMHYHPCIPVQASLLNTPNQHLPRCTIPITRVASTSMTTTTSTLLQTSASLLATTPVQSKYQRVQ